MKVINKYEIAFHISSMNMEMLSYCQSSTFLEMAYELYDIHCNRCRIWGSERCDIAHGGFYLLVAIYWVLTQCLALY